MRSGYMSKTGKVAAGAIVILGAFFALSSVAAARDNPKCRDPHWAYENSKFCPGIYGPGGIPRHYGANYYGYYDSGYYGPGYYEPSVSGFIFIDASGHRHYHKGRFNGRGFHGHSSWHRGHR
ncbi:MAG TPA: hypothetical protein VG867_09100 [Rhizomicrobium sp.]|nr:hypothetical protein [Rhizomicrobium sp.]